MNRPPHKDQTTVAWFHHSNGARTSTDTVIAAELKEQHLGLELTIAVEYTANLLAFAAAGHASYSVVVDGLGALPSFLMRKRYVPPARRMDGDPGALTTAVLFAKYLFVWDSSEFLVYHIEGASGTDRFSLETKFYILSPQSSRNDALLMAAGRWANELHNEIWVFDGGYWQKSPELYGSVMKASWDAVILDPDMKKSLIEDHLSFFSSRPTYDGLKVPWKRGIIYYGPPGNGKTISIKATMKMLYDLKEPIPTLYVRTLTSYGGPEWSIKEIFAMARRNAPCYLVFEDLDSIVTDQVRSYFLNEVDGLQSNSGIFMIGSTNHLERLDPGISKRPSRFDRKYFFPNPNLKERIAYCQFWQSKLADNDAIEFPDKLCTAIAKITDKFSFAYIQEAFVASLLAVARMPDTSREREKDEGVKGVADDSAEDWVQVSSGFAGRRDDNLDKLVLWVEMKKQVKILREGLEAKD